MVGASEGAGAVIEIKHYSPHQSGGFAMLLGPARGRNFTLHGDFVKPRPDLPLIQLGLFTSIEELPDPGPHDVELKPFIKTYVRQALSTASYQTPAREALER